MQILKEATSYKAPGEAVQMSLSLMCYYADPIYLTASNLGLHEAAPDYRSSFVLKKKKMHSQTSPLRHTGGLGGCGKSEKHVERGKH